MQKHDGQGAVCSRPQVSHHWCTQTILESITHFYHVVFIFLSARRYACLAGNYFVIPIRTKIGGRLLQLNFKNTMASNKSIVLKEADLTGITWLGDGATQVKAPFINVMNMSGEDPSAVVCVNGCTDHLVEGGKKDTAYINELFVNHVEEYDALKMNTDLFFFDSASNVQKTGEALTAKYPHAYCLYGGKHGVSLFFADVANIPSIKVCV